MTAPCHRQTLEVSFADTDASGWMHFPNAFRYFEQAEHAFLKQQGLLVFDRALGGWPRVSVSCDYRQPLVTGDTIEVLLQVVAVGTSSVTWAFEIHKSAGELAAVGKVVTVRVNEFGQPQAISEAERAVLSVAP